MAYEKTVKNLNKIRSAEIEMLRYGDPRQLIGMEAGILDDLKRQAINSEKDYQKRIELKMITNIIDYENYYSQQHQKKKEIFLRLVQDEDLYNTFQEEHQEAYETANTINNKINHKISKARAAINKIIIETQSDVQNDLNELKDLEIKEQYLFKSTVPVQLHLQPELGIGRYIDYIDNELFEKDERLERTVEARRDKRRVNPVLKHVELRGEPSFKFNNFDTKREILKGVNIDE